MTLTTDQRRALEILARRPNGWTGATLRAHGFGVGLLDGLVRDGLATASHEIVMASRRRITVTRVRITDAGRRAMAAPP
jgi:hypothetical protein